MIPNNSNNHYLRIYADCVPVLGKERSALYNLSLGFIKLIPNAMYELIKELQLEPVSSIRKSYHHCRETFEEYLTFLLEHNWAFITDTPKDFPQIEDHYYKPSVISNAVIEYGEPQGYDILALFDNLDQMNCKQIELRFDDNNVSIEHMHKVLGYCEGTTTRYICLLVRYNIGMKINELESLMTRYNKLGQLIVYGSESLSQSSADNRIILTHEDISKTLFYKPYPKNKYFVNMNFFYEALNANPYYNGKVAINKFGHIKNCLLHPNSFGNVNHNQLTEIISTESFQRLWKAKPDLIEDIRDSELRYCMFITDRLVEAGNNTFQIFQNGDGVC
ncbi:hypothetical protein [Pedobacter sp. R20-19]|uniref:hypothetical protein n=1 Tax=Pedobacter sp. R20-19 TaxID=1270196 RepID=UPI00049358F6|nr:hypothetical protein [Pedobacter sp. R20-19]